MEPGRRSRMNSGESQRFAQTELCREVCECDKDHQKADWVSIHKQICQLLIPIRTSLPCPPTERERKHGMEQLLRRQGWVFKQNLYQKGILPRNPEIPPATAAFLDLSPCQELVHLRR
uniref:MYND-type domain-containing protein n=1 Tax=Strigops habroptila TaxID=2489341 RepID=A0A672TJV7_STRHB